MQEGQRQGVAEIWAGDEPIAVHPRDQKPGQHFILPGGGRDCRRLTTGLGERRWRCISPSERWSGSPWKSTSWPL